MTAAETAFGCRSPDSKGPGHWDGAFVFVEAGGSMVAAVFEDNKDFVGHPKTVQEAITYYDRYVAQGWTPMTAADIEETAGVEVTARTARIGAARRRAGLGGSRKAAKKLAWVTAALAGCAILWALHRAAAARRAFAGR